MVPFFQGYLVDYGTKLELDCARSKNLIIQVSSTGIAVFTNVHS